MYLQQHKHGHLPYVPAEIFITDACGFHLSDDFITFQRLVPTKGINSVQNCGVFISDTFHEHNYGAKK